MGEKVRKDRKGTNTAEHSKREEHENMDIKSDEKT